jgi:hypothetical protein
MSALVISNPQTRRARRRLTWLQQALPETEALRHRVTGDPHEGAKLVATTPWEPGDTLVVNGGDGTAQRMLTALLGSCPSQRRPRIALLPGGTTNMTAFDLNRHRSYRRCVATLRDALDDPAPATRRRPLVQVGLPEGDQYGFFFGAGTIVQGIEYFHRRIQPGGGRHELGAGLALLRTVWGIARRQPPFAEPLQLSLPAASLQAAVADVQPPTPPHPAPHWHPLAARLCLVTSLYRLFLGIRPYWNHADAPLRATLVEASATAFLRSLPRLLRGRPGNALTPARGYHSSGLAVLDMRFRGPLTLDGELFSSDGDTIRLRSSEPLSFLIL